MGTTQPTNPGSKKFKNIDKKILKYYADVQPDNKDKPSVPTSAPRP